LQPPKRLSLFAPTHRTKTVNTHADLPSGKKFKTRKRYCYPRQARRCGPPDAYRQESDPYRSLLNRSFLPNNGIDSCLLFILVTTYLRIRLRLIYCFLRNCPMMTSQFVSSPERLDDRGSCREINISHFRKFEPSVCHD